MLPVRIGHLERAIAAAILGARDVRSEVGQALLPVLLAAPRNRERDLDAEPDSEVSRRREAEWKEGEVRTRMAVGVGVKQMVRARIVLVDAALH